jgi:chromosome segregation protein
MKIRRLEIQGFKSFADRTVLAFGEGITGVVGPNGCGKSNIVDAIRWAMGEQSAKHLRGQGMQDIIFAGSESRGPVGMAEVTVTFNNDGALVLPEYQKFDEISVTRRLFRDGTSEYAINKVHCRLRDVFDLFMGTGIGKQAYSIIEQGRIGLIVTAKPEDRRMFIEEAAGISRYKARRKQAERRIEATEQNLLRVSDITSELKQRIGSLERQAKKAERYKKIKSELKELDLCAAAHKHFELSALERFEIERQSATREAIEGKESALEVEEQRIREALSHLEAREIEVRAKEALIHQHEQAFALAKNNVELIGRERDAQIQRLKEAEAEKASLEVELVTLHADREAAERMHADLDASGGEEKTTLGEQEKALQALDGEIAGAEVALDTDKQAMVATLTTIAKHNNNLLNLDRAATDLSTRRARVEQAAEAIVEKVKALEKEAKELRHTLNENRQLKLALEDRRNAQEVLLERLRGELIENEASLLGARQELMDKRSRLHSLLEIQKNYEGCTQGVRSIMLRKEEDPDFSHALHGLVADFVSAEPRFETAIEAVLGERLQYVIVNSQSDGVASIDWLKRREDGRSSFIPLDLREDHVSWAPRPPTHKAMQTELPLAGDAREPASVTPLAATSAPPPSAGLPAIVALAQSFMPHLGHAEDDRQDVGSAGVGWMPEPASQIGAARPASLLPVPDSAEDSHVIVTSSADGIDLWPQLDHPGVCGKLVDLVTTPPGYEHVKRVLLGDVVVVEEIETARKLWRENGHRKTLVTLSGEVLDPVGVLTGGSVDGVSAGMLAQKREIKELDDQVRMLDARVRIAEDRHGTLKSRIADLDRAIKDLSKEGHLEEISIVRLERDLKRVEENLSRHADERKHHEQEVAGIVDKETETSIEADASRTMLRELEAERQGAEAHLEARAQSTSTLKEKARVLAEQVTALKVTVAANLERREGSERNLARIVARIKDVEQRLERLQVIISESTSEIARLEALIAQSEVDGTSLDRVLEVERSEIALVREKLDADQRQLRDEDTQTRGRRKEIDRLKAELAEGQMRAREYQLARATLTEQIDERYRTSILDVLFDFHLLPPQNDEHKERMEKLRDQIDSIGPINLTAIEEFNEVNERYTFLEGQKKDLEQAIASLRMAIKRINRTSKDRYVEAFRLVNEKFQQVFPRLFNGGSASLMMLDENDPLESGIEMLAQPPGKKLQSVNLLSGGEKALTAVSLIFSIFLIKPTPFCLLDEVDAPLDEANVGRYNELVRDMSTLSQFILITHNKKTMELPDRLYGVTMQEPGISQIVPVDIIGDRKGRLRAV